MELLANLADYLALLRIRGTGLPPKDQLIGTLLDCRYRLESLLGRGATSSVYLAWDTERGTNCAIKLLHSHLTADEAILSRFSREAKTAASLMHPNIAQVYSFCIANSGRAFIVMEYVDGITLAELLRREGWLSFERAKSIFLQIAAALSTAHERGVVHRDLKPSNVMLKNKDGEYTVKLLDFGSAKVAPSLGETLLKKTQSGEMLGSLLYMSPEQCLEQDADERSDCYSFACLMYETLTGKPPLSARTAFETMNLHMTTLPGSFSQVRPDLSFPEGIEGIIFKALAKAPEDRFASIADLIKALQSPQSAKFKLPAVQPSLESIAVIDSGQFSTALVGRRIYRSMCFVL